MTLEFPEKLNKDPGFAPGLHFSQYFNASPGLVILLLPNRRSGGWELGTSLPSAINNLVVRLSLWKRRVRKPGYEIGTDIRVGRVGTALSRRRTVN